LFVRPPPRTSSAADCQAGRAQHHFRQGTQTNKKSLALNALVRVVLEHELIVRIKGDNDIVARLVNIGRQLAEA
jgi:hypothetical protein